MGDLVNHDRPTPSFHGVDFDIIDRDGNRWFLLTQVSEGLGFADYRQLHKLIKRHADEFANKISVVKLTTESLQPVTVLSYDGVLLVGMLAKTDRSADFREYAITVLHQVMTQGYYLPPGVEDALAANGINLQCIVEKLTSLELELAALRTGMIPAHSDNSTWPTPAMRTKELLASKSQLVPRGFNRGGHFDCFFVERYHREHGVMPAYKAHHVFGRKPLYVIPRDKQIDRFLLQTYTDYQRRQVNKQKTLLLIMPRVCH